jgi:hypothetical protein
LEQDIDVYIQKWLDISDEHRQKAVWYVLLTWIIDKLHTIPYLRALGDYGCGKTRYLDVVGGICYLPMYLGGAIRSAPIFRTIDRWRGTAIFDEFNLQNSGESEAIIQILNQGYERDKVVLRCNQNEFGKVEAFDSFGGKILSSRRAFKDRALESRCITEVMGETDRDDIAPQLTKEFFKERDTLQNKLLLFRFRELDNIDTRGDFIDFGDIMPRIKQSFYPFAMLFKHDDGRLREFIDYVKEYNRQVVEDNSVTLDGQIVNTYVQMVDFGEFVTKSNPSDVITATDIYKQLEMDGWNKLDVRTVGRRLKALGFQSKPEKVQGKTKKAISIDESRLKVLKRRYVS